MEKTMTYENATLGGGCFWCLEAVYQEVKGVIAVESGYTGGHVEQPTYRQVCEGETGHVEVVRVTFDPTVISYHDILGILFAIHDPTTPNRQGNDVGPQYRSAIFVHSPEQRAVAQGLIKQLKEERVFDMPIVTAIEDEQTYWRAEESHQNYYRTHPEQGYCAMVIAPKLAKFRRLFSESGRG
jgi:peptide-methionine (S)-S-oxide reductase